jgi:3alpha(or 20beta)-hydroxysteroid dehydrogenase
MGRVADKVVVVTGAAGGQGAAEAQALAREGATVVAVDLPDQAPALEETRPEPGSSPGALLYRRLDVSRREDWAELASWIGRRHGRVDGLVNNAGVSVPGRIADVAPEDWQRALSVNLTGALLGIQALLPLMSRGGSIVNVGSVAGLTGYHAVAYTVSKWGLRGLSRVGSLELGRRGIRVNIIHPGYIETPMTASAPPGFREANLAETPLGRTGTVADVAPLVVFLISDESAYVSGAEIAVDGGLTAHGGMKSVFEAVVDQRGVE